MPTQHTIIFTCVCWKHKMNFFMKLEKNPWLVDKGFMRNEKNDIWSHGNATSWNQLSLNISRSFYDTINQTANNL